MNYTFDPPAALLRNSGEVVPNVVTISNARHVRGLALDVSGFEMIRHSASLADWNSYTDADRVRFARTGAPGTRRLDGLQR